MKWRMTCKEQLEEDDSASNLFFFNKMSKVKFFPPYLHIVIIKKLLKVDLLFI